MIHAHEMQHRCVQIVYVYSAIEDVVAVFVCEAMAHACLDARSSEPNTKTTRMMVATVVVGRNFPLTLSGAA